VKEISLLDACAVMGILLLVPTVIFIFNFQLLNQRKRLSLWNLVKDFDIDDLEETLDFAHKLSLESLTVNIDRFSREQIQEIIEESFQIEKRNFRSFERIALFIAVIIFIWVLFVAIASYLGYLRFINLSPVVAKLPWKFISIIYLIIFMVGFVYLIWQIYRTRKYYPL
jgi:hypothetical protein